jgi:hypothetical protein
LKGERRKEKVERGKEKGKRRKEKVERVYNAVSKYSPGCERIGAEEELERKKEKVES